MVLIGSFIDLSLAILKLLGGWAANSQALIADGVHSLSDLVTDGLVLIAARHSHVAADAEHPYGHERIETVVSVALGLVLIAVGIGIGWDAINRLWSVDPLPVPGIAALVIAALSVVSKEVIFHYSMFYARLLRSPMLQANAWHSRIDAWSSVVVIIGVGGAQLGLVYMDTIAAIAVAFLIAMMGAKLVSKNVAELIDTAIGAEQVKTIRRLILNINGIRDVHTLRTRQMGPKVLVDMHILLSDPRLSVSEGHQISEVVRWQLIQSIPEVDDVTVHIDPEDDESASPGRHLPLRNQILAELQSSWSDIEIAQDIQRITLHYLDGRLYIDVELPLAVLNNTDAEGLRRAFERNACEQRNDIAEVRLFFVCQVNQHHSSGNLLP